MQARQDERRTVTTTASTGTRLAPAARGVQRLVVLVLDLSGSMAGSLLDRVVDACQLITQRLNPDNFMVIWGFNSTTTRVH